MNVSERVTLLSATGYTYCDGCVAAELRTYVGENVTRLHQARRHEMHPMRGTQTGDSFVA
jgi:hypothetical protein